MIHECSIRANFRNFVNALLEYLEKLIIKFPHFIRHYQSITIAGTPRNIDYADVLNDLSSIEGVRLAHSLYIWSLTLNKSALAAHLAVGK